MTAPVNQAGDDQMMPDDDQMPEDDQMMPEELTADPADTAVGSGFQSSGSVMSAYLDATATGGGAEKADDESPSPVSAAGMQPASASESPLAAAGARPAGGWNEIQAMFVDDPRACVELAAGLVDDRVEAHVMSVRERQHSLLSAWQGADAGTEDLRVALQQYRAFWSRLEDFPAKTWILP